MLSPPQTRNTRAPLTIVCVKVCDDIDRLTWDLPAFLLFVLLHFSALGIVSLFRSCRPRVNFFVGSFSSLGSRPVSLHLPVT